MHLQFGYSVMFALDVATVRDNQLKSTESANVDVEVDISTCHHNSGHATNWSNDPFGI